MSAFQIRPFYKITRIRNGLVIGGQVRSGEFGDLELRVTVKGRLVAEDDAGLWALRDALADESAYEVTGGILEDGHGHEWTEMKLLTVDEDGAVARGRELSIGYTVDFGRLAI